MKRISFIIICLALCTGLLSGCVPECHANILLFTDNLNKINPDKKISLTDYIIAEDSYKLILTEKNSRLLLTAETNEKSEIKKIRLTLVKVDEKGKALKITEEDRLFFKRCAEDTLSAFTLCDKNESTLMAEKILPSKSDDFLKTGELNLDYNEFRLVYYSNKISCQLTVINTLLEEIEATEKPVSKPLYGVTANVGNQG